MKNIYRLLLGVIILVWSYSNCFSQATLTMGNINGIPGNSLSVPVQATGISDMVGFQFTITYDKTKLTYVNCTNWGGGTNAAGVQITPLDGKITFIYNDVAVNIASGKFFDLNFTVVNGSSGNTLLSWSDNPTARELSNSIPAEISCAYTNGSVTITSSGTSPVANFSATPINDCTPLTVNFADESTGNPTSWAWDIDNNGTVDYTIKNPIHTYNIAGTYSVKLTATNVSGSDSKTRLSYITANSTVSSSVSISASPSTIISSGQLVTFTATPINGGTNPTFVWKVNGVIEGNNNPTYSTSSLTNGKVVTCVMTSNSPCVSSASATSNSLIMTVNSTGASLIIGNINGVAGNAVSVPVTVSNLSDVVGFQFTITYDKTKLTYVNCTNWGGGANASGVQITPLDGKITFIYNDVAVNIASGKFFDLNFTVVNGSSGSALLSWSDNPTARELSNSIPAEISCSYANGSITITDCIAVSIASQPSDQKADIGSTATFSVTANGTAPFLYFWYKNGIQIAGATSSTYTTPVLTTADNGNTYYCNLVNCNAQSGITSRTATLIVSTGTCIPPLSPSSFTVSLGAQANGLIHMIRTEFENVLGAEGYEFDYSLSGTLGSWILRGTTKLTDLYWNFLDQPNMPVYFRIRAYKCSGLNIQYSSYIYASPQPIYTACDDPTNPAISGASTNSLIITLNAETPVENPSYTKYSIYSITTNQYVQANGTLGSYEVFQTRSTWGTKTVTGLSSSTQYCFYAKAKNNDGDIRFNASNAACGTTLSNEVPQTVKDIDGNEYTTVTIGTQVWMGQNLKTTKYNDGKPIPLVTVNNTWGSLKTSAYCWYNNDIGYKNPYGALYNWYAVNTGKLCPVGWHVPTDAEWTILTNYLGGESVAGGKLKEIGTIHWLSPNEGATNETGFTALPGGWRNTDGTSIFIGILGSFWSYTEDIISLHWVRHLSIDNGNANRSDNNNNYGFSVRCVRDQLVSSEIISVNDSIKVYPNPTSGFITIEGLPANKKSNLAVYSANGKLIIKKSTSNTVEKLDLSTQVPGIYLLDINNQSIKIIKK